MLAQHLLRRTRGSYLSWERKGPSETVKTAICVFCGPPRSASFQQSQAEIRKEEEIVATTTFFFFQTKQQKTFQLTSLNSWWFICTSAEEGRRAAGGCVDYEIPPSSGNIHNYQLIRKQSLSSLWRRRKKTVQCSTCKEREKKAVSSFDIFTGVASKRTGFWEQANED